jgi:hypothetical protein
MEQEFSVRFFLTTIYLSYGLLSAHWQWVGSGSSGIILGRKCADFYGLLYLL